MQGLSSVQTGQPGEAAGPRPNVPLVTFPVSLEAVGRIAGLGMAALRSRSANTWERPQLRSALFGFGAAARIQGSRHSAVSEVPAAIERITRGAAWEQVSHAARPRAFGGARFAPDGSYRDHLWDAFGGWEFTVPELLVACEDGEWSASLTVEDGTLAASDVDARVEQLLRTGALFGDGVGAQHQPNGHLPTRSASRAAYEGSVAAALQEIADGCYQKVVLARSVDVIAAAVDTGAVLSRLAERYPGCFIFKYRTGGRDWLGASPELLASVEGGTVRAVCLAGSHPRGTDEASDDRLRDELLASAKEREEHEFVRAAIQASVAPFCSALHHPPLPAVVRMANIQHLSTPFEGAVRPGVTLLDIVASLHPTPAVGGSPRDVAMEAIDRLEEMDRGWYAGPIGWIDFNGEGEFAVALRAGLAGAGLARLYAGAGIVAGSDPAHEYAETETKLRPLRESLAAG